MGIEKLSTEHSGEDLRIAILGRKNVGKSSLLNRINGGGLLNAKLSTTDIINKEIKLPHNGPVVTIDINDIEDLRETREKRINRTIRILSFADFAILVLDAREQLDDSETNLITCLQKIKVPFLIAVNKVELGINPHLLTELGALKLTHFEISCKENAGIENFAKKIIHLLHRETEAPLIIDLIGQNDIVLLIGQIDSDLTKEGFTKFQIHAMREVLNKEAICVVANEKELKIVLALLKNPPELVISDSRLIKKVSSLVPANVMLTTLSILVARQRGNLAEFVKGLNRIGELKNGDKILISEACAHYTHTSEIDIEEITSWLSTHTRKKLKFDFIKEQDFPENFHTYKLLIHCNGCNLNRKNMHVKIRQARLMGVPVVNYGLLISFMQGAIPRILLPFKEVS